MERREDVLRIGKKVVQSMREMEKNFCPTLVQPFLEIIDRRKLIPIFD